MCVSHTIGDFLKKGSFTAIVSADSLLWEDRRFHEQRFKYINELADHLEHNYTAWEIEKVKKMQYCRVVESVKKKLLRKHGGRGSQTFMYEHAFDYFFPITDSAYNILYAMDKKIYRESWCKLRRLKDVKLDRDQ